jgi:hypothetical protein
MEAKRKNSQNNLGTGFSEHLKELTEIRGNKFKVIRDLLYFIKNGGVAYFIMLWIYRILCGYGEKWWRTIASAAVLLLVFTLFYFFFNSVWTWSAFGHSLYFSAISFTAVGYGGWIDKNWIDIANNLIKGLGVFESFLGVFIMALFLVTFTRKMTR